MKNYCKEAKDNKFLMMIDEKLVNNQDDIGWTALMYACYNLNQRNIKYLIKKNADINIFNKDKNNALDILSYMYLIATMEYNSGKIKSASLCENKIIDINKCMQILFKQGGDLVNYHNLPLEENTDIKLDFDESFENMKNIALGNKDKVIKREDLNAKINEEINKVIDKKTIRVTVEELDEIHAKYIASKRTGRIDNIVPDEQEGYKTPLLDD